MAYNFQGVTVLIVEDNSAIVSLVSDVLKVFGVGNVIFAKNGEDGFKRYVDHNPDIILTEILLKQLDGPDMIKKIRNDMSSPNPYVPIIVLTAFSELKRIEKARDAGVNEIIIKPFTARDLYSRMAHVIEHPRQFVITDDFAGPDRRRKGRGLYEGPMRRYDDADATDKDGNRKFSIYTGRTPDLSKSSKTIKKSGVSKDKEENDKRATDSDIDIDFI